jgi:hypothetical protein
MARYTTIRDLADDLRADLTAADMGADRAAAIRAMRDEPGHVAEDVECTAEDVIVWCRIQGVL